MTTMTTAQKNEMVKNQAMAAIALPEGAIQIGDYSYAIPVEVAGEPRYAKFVLTACNNKDTKTTDAFDPEVVRQEWLDDKAFKAKKAEQAAADKAARAAKKSKKSKKADE